MAVTNEEILSAIGGLHRDVMERHNAMEQRLREQELKTATIPKVCNDREQRLRSVERGGIVVTAKLAVLGVIALAFVGCVSGVAGRGLFELFRKLF